MIATLLLPFVALNQIFFMCREIGVHTSPRLLGDEMVVVPLQAWHCSKKEDAAVVGAFDAMCSWPPELGDPCDAHNSVRFTHAPLMD